MLQRFLLLSVGVFLFESAAYAAASSSSSSSGPSRGRLQVEGGLVVGDEYVAKHVPAEEAEAKRQLELNKWNAGPRDKLTRSPDPRKRGRAAITPGSPYTQNVLRLSDLQKAVKKTIDDVKKNQAILQENLSKVQENLQALHSIKDSNPELSARFTSYDQMGVALKTMLENNSNTIQQLEHELAGIKREKHGLVDRKVGSIKEFRDSPSRHN